MGINHILIIIILACEADLAEHVRVAHTFAANRGTRAYLMAREVVRQRFQESLPKVQLRGGIDLRNVYKKKWVGMTYTADGGQDSHVRERLSWAGTEFNRQRKALRSGQLLLRVRISGYKGAVLVTGTFGCEAITLTPRIVRRYVDFNTRCLSAMTGRSLAAERTEPTFDIMAWIHWRRAR